MMESYIILMPDGEERPAEKSAVGSKHFQVMVQKEALKVNYAPPPVEPSI